MRQHGLKHSDTARGGEMPAKIGANGSHRDEHGDFEAPAIGLQPLGPGQRRDSRTTDSMYAMADACTPDLSCPAFGGPAGEVASLGGENR